MKNIDAKNHLTGKSIYVDDVPEVSGTLHTVVFTSPIAHGKIISINVPQLPRDCYFIDSSQIPGENQIGGIVQDEPLLADRELHFLGQPIGLVLAPTLSQAYKIRDAIEIEYEELEAIVDPRVAKEKNQLIIPPKVFKLGEVDTVWDECEYILEGRVDSGGQEHLYIETQGAYAIPTETGYTIISSTQGPTAVQKTVTKVLGIPMHKIEVDVRRLGGGFGGKEDQATAYGCMAALGAYISKRPVKLILDRHDDLKMTGKRHPYSSDYKIGLKGKKILAYEVNFYQNAGAAADLSPAVLGRTLAHATNSYFIPNVTATAYCCRTNLPPNTAFRGFGGPQGMFVIESAIHKLAEKLGIEAREIQFENLLEDGDEFPYGQKAENVSLEEAWYQVEEKTYKMVDEIRQFNLESNYIKKGYAVMPVCFGISFNNTMMNQASALVNVYLDGSIGVSTGAVEMGQGVNTRILQAVQQFFSISEELVKMETTNTTRAINTSPSAASSTHDLNGWAAIDACKQIGKRLLDLVREENNDPDLYFSNGYICSEEKKIISWHEVVNKAIQKRVDLAAHGYYATPKIYFDNQSNKGHPFAYHAMGVAMISVELDCLRGTYQLLHAEVVHDSGKSLNSVLDLGQVEGALVQGLGWMLLEDLQFSNSGVLLSSSLSTYKIPDINFVPSINTTFIGKDNPLGLMGSKAIGEPPLMFGIGGYFAVRNAMKAFKQDLKMAYDSPLTPEKIILSLYKDDLEE